ncbi:unnamed protein product [Nezara viridula]|uniref:Uncharacterized protein n=1 Tax=Nezara viridula TaxID=85310 RepID=A0A9P0H657_NEZVI|nr:unnamed protein product [Nezara viridula]
MPTSAGNNCQEPARSSPPRTSPYKNNRELRIVGQLKRILKRQPVRAVPNLYSAAVIVWIMSLSSHTLAVSRCQSVPFSRSSRF